MAQKQKATKRQTTARPSTKRVAKTALATSTKKPLHRRVVHHAINTVVPRRHNNYRPHLINRYGLTVMLLLAGSLISWNFHTQRVGVLGQNVDISQSALLADTNQQRQAQGESALKINPQLSQAAQDKAKDMFANQYWAHISPSGVTPWHWFDLVGYNYAYAGENLAKNFSSAGATVAAWMASPKHRANILDTHYTDIGFAVAHGTLQGQPTTLVVALYGAQQSSAPAVAAATTAAPPHESLTPVSRLGIAVTSMNATTAGALTILTLGVVVALATFTVEQGRGRLAAVRVASKSANRRSWYTHHTVPKMAALSLLIASVTLLLGSGQL